MGIKGNVVPVAAPTAAGGIIDPDKLPHTPTAEPDFAPTVLGADEALDLPPVVMSERDVRRATDLVEKQAPLVFEDDEDDEAQEIMNDPLVIAAKSGDRRKLLEALRDRLAVALVTTTSGRDIAAIARNLNLVSKELAGIPDPNAEGDEVDQMADMVRQMQA